jgi:hypothetical protein
MPLITITGQFLFHKICIVHFRLSYIRNNDPDLCIQRVSHSKSALSAAIYTQGLAGEEMGETKPQTSPAKSSVTSLRLNPPGRRRGRRPFFPHPIGMDGR